MTVFQRCKRSPLLLLFFLSPPPAWNWSPPPQSQALCPREHYGPPHQPLSLSLISSLLPLSLAIQDVRFLLWSLSRARLFPLPPVTSPPPPVLFFSTKHQSFSSQLHSVLTSFLNTAMHKDDGGDNSNNCLAFAETR